MHKDVPAPVCACVYMNGVLFTWVRHSLDLCYSEAERKEKDSLDSFMVVCLIFDVFTVHDVAVLLL